MRITLLLSLLFLFCTETSFASTYEHGVFLAPRLEEHNAPDTVIHELRPAQSSDYAFCVRTPHAKNGVAQHCFNAKEASDFLSYSAPWLGIAEAKIWLFAGKSFALHCVYTQGILHLLSGLPANPIGRFVPGPAGLSLSWALLQGSLVWAAHLSVSAMSLAYLAITGQAENYLAQDSAFRSDEEQQAYNKNLQSLAMRFSMHPLMTILSGFSPQPDPALLSLLSNQHDRSSFRKHAGFTEDTATGPILLQKTNGFHNHWSRTLRYLTGDNGVTLKSKPLDPKVFLDGQKSQTRTIEICGFNFGDLEKSKESYLETCKTMVFQVDENGVRVSFEGRHGEYSYSWAHIHRSFDADVDQALRDRLAQFEAAKPSPPIALLWKYPRVFMSYYPVTRVLSEAFLTAGLIATGIKLVGLNPFIGQGRLLFTALMPVVGGQMVQYMESFFPKAPESQFPRKPSSEIREELISYFISNPPENGRRYIFLSQDAENSII